LPCLTPAAFGAPAARVAMEIRPAPSHAGSRRADQEGPASVPTVDDEMLPRDVATPLRHSLAAPCWGADLARAEAHGRGGFAVGRPVLGILVYDQFSPAFLASSHVAPPVPEARASRPILTPLGRVDRLRSADCDAQIFRERPIRMPDIGRTDRPRNPPPDISCIYAGRPWPCRSCERPKQPRRGPSLASLSRLERASGLACGGRRPAEGARTPRGDLTPSTTCCCRISNAVFRSSLGIPVESSRWRLTRIFDRFALPAIVARTRTSARAMTCARMACRHKARAFRQPGLLGRDCCSVVAGPSASHLGPNSGTALGRGRGFPRDCRPALPSRNASPGAGSIR